MGKVLVIAEHRDGKLKKSSFELLQASTKAGNQTVAVLLGATGIESLAPELGTYGAKEVHVLTHADLQNYTAEAYTKALLPFIKSQNPDTILASHTPTGRDLMPHLSAQLGVGLASDCVQVQFSGSSMTLRRPIYSGKATAEVEFMGSGPKMATVRPNALGLGKADASLKAEVKTAPADIGGLRTKFVELVKGASARPDVTEAAIVVSGGRSLKSAENFKILETMADTIGAAVGASRAAVDSGFRPHRDQVGQTGKTVSPSLYIACGISGAIQHLAGMRSSKVIVAINTDPQAPIFQVADYGVVADLFTLVPLLEQEFKKLKEH